MDREKVLKLANLARIRITDAEADTLSHEFDAILNYVSEVKSVAREMGAKTPEQFPVRNVMREDNEGHEPGIHTETLLSAAPAREGNYVKVKKILS